MFTTFVAQKAPAGRRKNKAALRKRDNLIEKCKSQSANCAVAPNLQERFSIGVKQCCSHRRVAGHQMEIAVSKRIPRAVGLKRRKIRKLVHIPKQFLLLLSNRYFP